MIGLSSSWTSWSVAAGLALAVGLGCGGSSDAGPRPLGDQGGSAGSSASAGGSGGHQGGQGGGGAGGQSGSSAGGASGQGGAGGQGGGATYPRQATTRALLPTRATNLLVDPFVTSDQAWGHFVAFFAPSTEPYFPLKRTFVSESPIGVTAPVVVLDGLKKSAAGASKAWVLTAFSGGAGALTGALWVSAGDGDGAPATYASQASVLTAALYTVDEQTKYVLEADPSTRVTLGGREWVRLTVTVPEGKLAQGGWFEIGIDLKSKDSSWRLAAPELTDKLTPAGAGGPAPLLALPRAVAEDEKQAMRTYARLVRR